MPDLLHLRGGGVSEWEYFDPILSDLEPAIVIFDDGSIKMKVGDGSTRFLSLPYLSPDEAVYATKVWANNTFVLKDDYQSLLNRVQTIENILNL